MKRLILVRHAKTEPLMGSLSDFERQLKQRGFKDASLVAGELKRKNFNPEVLIASPAKRAIQTARIYAEVFGLQFEEIKQEMFMYDGDTTARMLDFISDLAGNANTVMVVGHNPDMVSLSMLLTQEKFYHFPTSATSVITFDINNWKDMNVGEGQLEFFTYPKELKKRIV